MGTLSKEIERRKRDLVELANEPKDEEQRDYEGANNVSTEISLLETLQTHFPHLDHPACLHVEEMADMIGDLQHRYHFDADCKEACYGICMDAKALLQKIKEGE